MRAIETCRSADLGGHCPFFTFQTTQLITRIRYEECIWWLASWVYDDWQRRVAGVSLKTIINGSYKEGYMRVQNIPDLNGSQQANRTANLES